MQGIKIAVVELEQGFKIFNDELDKVKELHKPFASIENTVEFLRKGSVYVLPEIVIMFSLKKQQATVQR